MRSIAAALGGLGLVAALSGCAAQSAACDAAFIPDQFSIAATSASGAGVPLVLCIDGRCSAPVPNAGRRRETVGGTTTENSRASVFAQARNRWSVALGDGPRPTVVTVRVGPVDAPVVVRTLHLSWHRGDPSDPCHHWYTVDPVRITVP